MAFIKGVWVFNDTISITSDRTYVSSHYSCVKKYTFLYSKVNYNEGGNTLIYHNSSTDQVIAYTNGKWASEDLRIVDFDSGMQVSEDDYQWFTENAVRTNAVVWYNDGILMPVPEGQTATLKCGGKKTAGDIAVTSVVPLGRRRNVLVYASAMEGTSLTGIEMRVKTPGYAETIHTYALSPDVVGTVLRTWDTVPLFSRVSFRATVSSGHVLNISSSELDISSSSSGTWTKFAKITEDVHVNISAAIPGSSN